jgi:hypothetical protein
MNAADLDVLWNRIAIAQSRSQRLVESWLAPVQESSDSKRQEAETTQEGDGFDAELAASSFSDTTGVGYRPSASTLEDALPSRSLASNERLRSLLLGSQSGKGSQKSSHISAGVDSGRPSERLMGSLPVQPRGQQGKEMVQSSHRSNGQGSRAKLHPGKRVSKTESSDEEELGRSAIGRKKQKQ